MAAQRPASYTAVVRPGAFCPYCSRYRRSPQWPALFFLTDTVSNPPRPARRRRERDSSGFCLYFVICHPRRDVPLGQRPSGAPCPKIRPTFAPRGLRPPLPQNPALHRHSPSLSLISCGKPACAWLPRLHTTILTVRLTGS